MTDSTNAQLHPGRRWLAALVLAALALATVFVISLFAPSEPTHQGKPASYWITQYGSSVSVPFPGKSIGTRVIRLADGRLATNTVYLTFERDVAVNAFQEMGTTGHAILLAGLERDDSPLLGVYRELYAGPLRFAGRVLPEPGIPASDYRNNAISILGNLHPQPENSLKALLNALDDPDKEVSENALSVLERKRPLSADLRAAFSEVPLESLPTNTGLKLCHRLRPDFAMVLTFVSGTLGNSDPSVRESTLAMLESYTDNATEIVPLAVAALRDPNHNVRYRAVYVLNALNTNAVAALPELRVSLNDESVIVRNGARRAISAIEGSTAD